MKTLKKIIGLAMAMVMMAMSFAVYAETTEEHVHDGCCVESVTDEEEGIMPRAAECGKCKKMTLRTSIVYGGSYTVWRSCVHGAIGNDSIQVTPVYYRYTCSSCGFDSGLIYDHDKEVVTYCPAN